MLQFQRAYIKGALVTSTHWMGLNTPHQNSMVGIPLYNIYIEWLKRDQMGWYAINTNP